MLSSKLSLYKLRKLLLGYAKKLNNPYFPYFTRKVLFISNPGKASLGNKLSETYFVPETA